MHAVLVLVALSLPTQPDTVTPRPIVPSRPVPAAAPGREPGADEGPKVFTLEELAAGARNDAFVDEFLKDKALTLYGAVQRIERVNNETDPLAGPTTLYRVVMVRTGHDAQSLDTYVHLYFALTTRKDLAILEPGVTKIAVQGKCTASQLEKVERGMNFILQMENCKIVPTPAAFEAAPARPRIPIIPNVIPDVVPPPALPFPPVPAPAPAPADPFAPPPAAVPSPAPAPPAVLPE